MSDIQTFTQFETSLERLRRRLKIPGMSAAIVRGRRLVWAKGFGYADLEKGIQATRDTPFRIASITKTFASVIIMQLVEEGRLDLDDPVAKYGVEVRSRGTVRVRHILSHTSEYLPGKYFRYSGRVFGHLDRVIEAASGKRFRELLIERVIDPLELSDTAPNKEPDSIDYPFEELYGRLARPYGLDESFEILESSYRLGFFTAGGLISTVVDMAKYDAAIDNNILLSPETKRQMFTPAVSTDGDTLPYGLGWFTQHLDGTLLVWHHGWNPDRASSLMLKVPERDISFILFANSDKLSQPFGLRHGDVLNSPPALLFLRTFVFRGAQLAEIRRRESIADEVISYAGGERPVIGLVENLVLICCLLLFLSALIGWPTAFLLRRLRPRRRAPAEAPRRRDATAPISRIYASLPCALSLVFLGVLPEVPFLVYWRDLPGWIDGIPLYQNVVLGFPSLIAVLSMGLLAFVLVIWRARCWSLLGRWHYTSIVLAAWTCTLFMCHWRLVGIGYYWSLLRFSL